MTAPTKPRIQRSVIPTGYACSRNVRLQADEYNVWIKWLWKELKKL